MPDLARLLDLLNFRIPFGRWQLFEFTDLLIVPPFVKHDRLDVQRARWEKKITIIQQQSPAELAADAVNECLQRHTDVDKAPWKVIDFGSGQGGPVPVINMLLNHGRAEAGKSPIPVVLTDLHPNLDTWMIHASHSKSLSFAPQPVDAADPSFSVISTTTKGDKEAAARAGLESNGHKVFRLFCSTFHHFDDETAVRVLKSTMTTSDAFAIIELQERRILSLVQVLLETFLLVLMALFWFWRDKTHLACVYVVPLLPFTQFIDGLVTSLRMRNFEETLQLVAKAYGQENNAVKVTADGRTINFRNWQFRHSRVLHTWPIGYMNVITGTRCPSND